MKKIHLKGNFETKQVWLNGKLLRPERSLSVRRHSPDGFNWGYGGSGPAQLALAICLEIFGQTFKEKKFNEFGLPFKYQNFKWDHIATLPQSDFDKEIEVPMDKYLRPQENDQTNF